MNPATSLYFVSVEMVTTLNYALQNTLKSAICIRKLRGIPYRCWFVQIEKSPYFPRRIIKRVNIVKKKPRIFENNTAPTGEWTVRALTFEFVFKFPYDSIFHTPWLLLLQISITLLINIYISPSMYLNSFIDFILLEIVNNIQITNYQCYASIQIRILELTAWDILRELGKCLPC